MASSAIPATIDTPFQDSGQSSRHSSRSPRRTSNMVSRGSANSLNEQAGAGPVSLPPLHPKQSNNATSLSSFLRTRTSSDYDNDSVSVISTGSSVVPVDVGQHGFITYNDDASSTGSLVLGYEQGRDVPPAAYDLPAAIFNVYNPNNIGDDRLIGEGLVPNRYSFNSLSVKTPQSQRSETDSVLLPYHVRTKLNASQNTTNYSESESAITQLDVKAPLQSTGYGSIEAGSCLAPPVGYYQNDDGGQQLQQQQNIAFDHSVGSYNNPYHSLPLCAPYEEPCVQYNGQNASVFAHSHQTQSSNGIVYVSMLIALVLFIVAVYALFYIMKTMH